ncbi:MAG: thioredoxin domain-containing protein [Patescibacteria group bacterium]
MHEQFTKQEKRELRREEREKEGRGQKTKIFMRRLAMWSFVVFVVGGTIFGMAQLANSPSLKQPALLLDAVSATDWMKGGKEAKIILVEYSDFQCPACAAYYPFVKQLTQDFGDKLQIVYRHFPLRQIHKNADASAYAAEAAGRQGKFWEMHDMIFDNQSEWANKYSVEETFVNYATALGLDIEKFKSDIDSKEVKDKVENDYLSGIRSNVNATPTFFLNGKKILNPRSYDEFKTIINQAGDSASNN